MRERNQIRSVIIFRWPRLKTLVRPIVLPSGNLKDGAKAESLNSRTLDLHLTAISQWHHHQGLTDPAHDLLVRKTMDGIRRTHGQPKRKAKALRLEHIAQMVNHLRQQPDNQKNTVILH